MGSRKQNQQQSGDEGSVEAALDAKAEGAPDADSEGRPSEDQAREALGQDVGYIGRKVDPRPNEEYSQETDPTVSPSAAEQQADAARARLEDQERAAKGDD